MNELIFTVYSFTSCVCLMKSRRVMSCLCFILDSQNGIKRLISCDNKRLLFVSSAVAFQSNRYFVSRRRFSSWNSLSLVSCTLDQQRRPAKPIRLYFLYLSLPWWSKHGFPHNSNELDCKLILLCSPVSGSRSFGCKHNTLI